MSVERLPLPPRLVEETEEYGHADGSASRLTEFTSALEQAGSRVLAPTTRNELNCHLLGTYGRSRAARLVRHNGRNRLADLAGNHI
jgi:hypothetical protein